jgi:hypothetical protein
MSARRWVLVAVVAVAAFAAAFALASRGDDGPEADPGPSVPLDALEGDARELVALADAGRALRHHATYEQPGGDRFEVWVDGERVREDVTPDDGDLRRVLRTGDGGLSCVQSGGSWTCTDADVAVGGGLQGRLEQLSGDLVGADVTATDATVAGQDARCFAIASPDDPIEICLTDRGILARLAAGDERIELVDLDDDVPGSTFDRPDTSG